MKLTIVVNLIPLEGHVKTDRSTREVIDFTRACTRRCCAGNPDKFDGYREVFDLAGSSEIGSNLRLS